MRLPPQIAAQALEHTVSAVRGQANSSGGFAGVTAWVEAIAKASGYVGRVDMLGQHVSEAVDLTDLAARRPAPPLSEIEPLAAGAREKAGRHRPLWPERGSGV